MVKKIKKKYKIFLYMMSFIFLLSYATDNDRSVKLNINGKTYHFEVAKTPEEKAKGLMFRKDLDENNGMLFIFDQSRFRRFYMKNTYIPLDIAFIDSELKIIDIQKMEPLNEKPIISKFKAQYALEVNRGFFVKAEIKLGDEIVFISGGE
ncbi:MAG: DUF192 domain-containing protein [Candidatus Omnitrophica bacterium]|nr:DUF192 domain-containing protein [Candidatus Omnitrophota bacterium]MCK5494133.1 DUF192 domain-containing protein [Candidatus Omnitrophota bacterium]